MSIFDNLIVARYVISGAAATVTTLGLLYLLTDGLHLWYLFSAVIAFIVGVGVSFVFQKFWTFRNEISEPRTVARQSIVFFIIAAVNLLLNSFLIYVFVDFFHFWYFLAQIIVAGLLAVASFFVYRLIFSK